MSEVLRLLPKCVAELPSPVESFSLGRTNEAFVSLTHQSSAFLVEESEDVCVLNPHFRSTENQSNSPKLTGRENSKANMTEAYITRPMKESKIWTQP
jgi:hypothetical protein